MALKNGVDNLITFINEGDFAIIATKKDISFVINEDIVGPFPNKKNFLLLLIDTLESSFEKGRADEILVAKLAKEWRKHK